MNFALKWGYPKWEVSLIKRNVLQFINYVLWVQSTQQLFIVAPALSRRLLHNHICFDIYSEMFGVATIEVYTLDNRFY